MAGRSGLFKAAIELFTEPPAGLRREDHAAFKVAMLAFLLAGSIHFAFLVVFWRLGVRPMALFNIFSPVLYAFAIWLCRRGKVTAGATIALCEVAVHQVLCVYFIGWEAGAQYYLICVAPFAVFVGGRSVFKVLWLVLLPGLYLALYLGLRHAQPPFVLDAATLTAMHSTNIIVLITLTILWPWILRSTVLEEARTSGELERLAEHDRLKSRLIANVSHELRTPLTLVLTPLKRMLAGAQGDLDEQQRAQLRSMHDNAQRLLRQVNQLLDFSAIESGGATVAYEERDVRQLVEGIVEAFQPFARSKGLKLTLRGPEDLPRAHVDPEKLDKVVCNLLSNACKFTDAGGAVVVRLTASEGGERLQVAVKDTGRGIAEADLPRVFERFRQISDGIAREHQGSGIGLALARELTELTGGTLTVESELGAGSTFCVGLPLGTGHIGDPALIRPAGAEATSRALDHADALAAEADKAAPAATPVEGKAADRATVLVVEDNPDMRALVREICEGEYRVIEAADGEQGLVMVREHRPDLVISDVMMPRLDGQEMLRRLRDDAQTASIPVMLLTARAGADLKLEGLERGADDYLEKPFDARELLARARNLVRQQQQQRALQELTARLQQEVMEQATALERVGKLGRFLPPEVVRAITEEGAEVEVAQQRLQLTVFRLELRGFDQVVRQVEPEALAAMLNSYLSAVTDLALEQGATVVRLERDALLGFFGAPRGEGAEQDAVRCARAVRELWSRAVEVCGRWSDLLAGVPVPAPTAALASGFATVGNFGASRRLEYTAIGGPMDEVRELMEGTPTGEVVCTTGTWALIDGAMGDEAGVGATVTGQSGVTLRRLAGPPEREVFFTGDEEALAPTESDASPSAGPDPTDAAVDLEPGAVIAGRYEIVRELGTGGMGKVLLVNDAKLEVPVALKLLRNDGSGDDKGLERLRREVRLARLVSHANVARIYDLGEWAGCEFITMEYLEGQTLAQRLTNGGLPAKEGLRILSQLCAGLGAAHAAGVVHRDLKPHNIVLCGGRAVILDFGIARPCVEQQQPLTESHALLGTPHYMAPEQFDGCRVDARADLYALGVVAFEIFTGQRPFEAESAFALGRLHLDQAPPDPLDLAPELPALLGAVIQRCLKKEPARRFATATQIAEVLATLQPSV